MSGRRNEPARARRRAQLKEALSLTSVPKSEDDAAGALTTRNLNIQNHFGWVVLQKSQIGDGNFPHLFQYYEKPDIHGRHFDKVTYVLYMDKGTVIDKNVSHDGTQTAVSGILISEEPPASREYYDRTRVEQTFERELQPERSRVVAEPVEDKSMYYTPERRKRKKLISEFYYVRRARSRSRLPGEKHKGGYSDADSERHNPTSDLSKTDLAQINREIYDVQNNTMKEKDHTVLVWKDVRYEQEDAVRGLKNTHVPTEMNREIYEVQNKAMKEKDRTSLVWKDVRYEQEDAVKDLRKVHVSTEYIQKDVYKLRAGGDKIEIEYKELRDKYRNTPGVVKNKSSKVLEYVKSKSDKCEIAEELMKTSSGTNQYLYVSGKKRLR